jgi:hypothetical protein
MFKICKHNRKEEEELRHREKYDVGKIAGVEMERKNTEKKKVTELILLSSLHFNIAMDLNRIFETVRKSL